MTYCVYVDNEEEESGLSLEDAIGLEEEIFQEDPEAMIRIEPESEDDFDLDEDGDEEDEEEEEDEE